MLDAGSYKWLTFDCYGTIVDWETGITRAVAGLFLEHGVRRTPSEILALFADAEPRVQASEEFLSYRQVLRDVMQLMSWEAGIRLKSGDAERLPASLPEWPIFPEAAASLRAMMGRYKLGIISNVDDDLFAGTSSALGIEFDVVITSQQAGCYKPKLTGFELAEGRMAVERGNWLHVGESLFHDIGPANRLGIDSVWVKRPDRGGGTRLIDAVPTLEVASLADLAALATGS